MDEPVQLAQESDIMFERNIAIIASRKLEVQVFSDGFVYEGYLCGLDEKWLQLYGHEESNKNDPNTQWRFLLMGRGNISAVGPTGNGLHDEDADTREWIDKKISTFAGVCDKFLNQGKKNDSRRAKNQ